MSLQLDGTSGIQFNDGSDQSTAATPYGRKNLIINGDMRIDQRNAGASANVSAGDTMWSVDRWMGSCSQANKFTLQQSTTSPNEFQNSMVATVTSTISVGAGDYAGILQRIEGFNTAHLAWGTSDAKTVTLSFWIRSSVVGTYHIALRNNDDSRSYVSSYVINSADTWEKKTITIAGDTSGTWLTTNGKGIVVYFTYSCGSTYGSATNETWSNSLGIATSSQTQWIETSGATFYITGCQLEVGDSASDFEFMPYDMELARCQRYYQTWGGVTNYDVVCTGVCTGGQYTEQVLNYSTTMRAAPTMTYSALGDWEAVSVSASPTLAALNIDLTTTKSTRVATQGTTSPYTTGYAVYMRANNTTNARFNLSAEL